MRYRINRCLYRLGEGDTEGNHQKSMEEFQIYTGVVSMKRTSSLIQIILNTVIDGVPPQKAIGQLPPILASVT